MRPLSSLLLPLAALCSAGLAHAQEVNYGALEQLFGESVTTSATGSPQRITDVPVTMEIVTADDIRRSGADNLPAILSHVAGIDVMQWTSDEADLSVRGYDSVRSKRLLVLIDGRQVYADYYGYTPWSTLPVELSAIRQIEIVKGPNSALFGFNAVNGVINIITYDPLYDDVNTVSVSAGTQQLREGSAAATLRLGDHTAWRLTAGSRRNDDFSTAIPPSSQGAPRLNEKRDAIELNGVIELGEHAQLELEGSHTQADQIEMDPLYAFSYERYVANSAMIKFSAETRAGLLQASGYTNWIRDLDWGGPDTPLALFQDQLSVVQLQDLFKIGTANTVRLSAEYRHASAPTVPVTGARVFYDVLSAAAMWDWQLTPGLTLTNALRVDQLSLVRQGYVPPGYPLINSDWNHTATQPSFNTALVRQLGGRDTLRLSVARGVQIPSLPVYLSTEPPVTNLPTIQPTVVMNYELGWDHAWQATDGQWRVSVFRQTSVGLLSPIGGVISAPGTDMYFVGANIGDSHMDGLELSLSGRVNTNWRWSVAYRHEIVRDRFSDLAQGGSAYVDYEDTTPTDVIKANLGWAYGPWEVDGYGSYQSATNGLTPDPAGFGSVLTPVPAHVTLDGRVGYRPTQWATLALSGQNLLHAHQLQTSGPDIERRVLATVTLQF